MGDAPGGTAIYFLASFANHSCEPNCDVCIAPGGALALRARRSIAALEPLTITYLDSSLPVEFRRKKLLMGYGFDCNCELCEQQLKATRRAHA
jgi:SET domain-containing protein